MPFRLPFHLVTLSPWPFYIPVFVMGMAVGAIGWFHTGYWCYGVLNTSFWFLAFGSYMWWRDVVRESNKMGAHTIIVAYGLRIGVLLFITSEVMFFFAFFWGLYHGGSENPVETGDAWPPSGLEALSAFEVPLLNTLVLLSSGVTLTLGHLGMLEHSKFKSVFYMAVTVILGVYFTFLQWGEYADSSYCFADNSFGSVFFVATGFHGFHVLVGTTFLLVCLIRMLMKQFNSSRHVGLEAAAWYWHFVDVVWLFLFMSVYWWGG